ncbi:hypothetical protein [Curtobacterium flaccumfaciens]|uniref:hypothetical protein n=1 Tax=Curtobacterium flaccumfaciens TaxID=2035 RepID=UPI001BDE407F|nr:hypothetical protein [Curtobacterium flaccumfaciens]MBT1633246.1 hypothetical protein [Curtobacterium flaccumfaciens pv. oortii]MCX2846894.1 hypothetical protein [Curtobacterium flaccumfaciens pv. oortii]
MTWKRAALILAAVFAVLLAIITIRVATQLRHTHTEPAQTSTPIPTRSAAPSSAAIAQTVADRFCQPAATKNAWQRSLTQYLTPDAWQLYSAVQPANVPCAGVHEDGQPVGDQQTATDRAYQFTAATGGPVTVTLHRDTAADPWLASYVNAGQE